jgi:hypothetical protein
VAASSIQVIHHATNVIQQSATGSGIVQHATLEPEPKIAALLLELREAVSVVSPSPESKTDASNLIDLADEELSTPKPRRSKLATLFKALPVTDKILSITSSILEIAGKLT